MAEDMWYSSLPKGKLLQDIKWTDDVLCKGYTVLK
jgi:hypothetical protein